MQLIQDLNYYFFTISMLIAFQFYPILVNIYSWSFVNPLYCFQFSAEARKTLSEIRATSDHTILYFPLKNSIDKVVGYRRLQAGKEEEIECYGLHSAGLFSCQAAKVSRSDVAILVPSIQDVLHLASQKVPGMYSVNNSTLKDTTTYYIILSSI